MAIPALSIAATDTHCHILPGLDDGPQSLDAAVEMAWLAMDDGVARVVATPHLDSWNVDACRRAQAGVRSLQRELALSGVRLTMLSGAEMMVTPALLETPAHDRLHTLNGSRYLLIELPGGDFPLYTAEAIFALQLRGLVPILAHPERNAVIQDDINRLAALVERGVLTQITARSLLDRATRNERRCAQQLLKRGLAHLIASDAHDTGPRGPCLSAGVRAAGRIVGQQRAEAMVTRIPDALLSDQDVAPTALAAPEPVRWWRGIHFLRRDGRND